MTTLYVAVAGIAATALVGLAAAGGAWLSARDDRREQSALARQALNYERRVAVYLDAIDFVENQERALWEYGLTAENKFRKPPDSLPRHFPLPAFFGREFIPFDEEPPQRLTSRLRALGSIAANNAFDEVETVIPTIPFMVIPGAKGRARLSTDTSATRRLGRDFLRFNRTYREFYNAVSGLEGAVHAELGAE